MDMISTINNNEEPRPGPMFSAEFNDFISKCLMKDPERREKAEALLNHVWLQGVDIN